MGRMKIRRNEYEILNQMLDDAIAGTFEENCFDERQFKGTDYEYFPSDQNTSYQYTDVFGAFNRGGSYRAGEGICR